MRIYYKMESIIEVKNLGKKYNIAHQRGGYVALRDVLTNILKNPFRFAKDKTKKSLGIGTKEEFWALNDVNFEVNKGEVIGIIGKNGAGKSTLLKILSKITPPTTGEIKISGRVGSLLEVGTGFHPELTGRENIFLNGAILGMTRHEIAKKFDQIVEFSGIEKFLDTPVKYYSSGMYVRLAFSVAAHMEPDILIVDEVLAVGDAEFQKKCLGKMEEVTKQEGRTILFVSHNMSAIQNLCQRCILLKEGKVEVLGETEIVVKQYLNVMSKNTEDIPLVDRKRTTQKATLRAKLTGIEIIEQSKTAVIRGDLPIKIKLKIESYAEDLEATIQLIIGDESQNLIFINSVMQNKVFSFKKGLNELECDIKALNLYAGDYKINCYITIPGKEIIDYVPDALYFSVTNLDPYETGFIYAKEAGSGCFYVEHNWLTAK